MDKKTILVADDDAAIRTVLNRALMQAGFEVRVTSNISTLWNWISDGYGQVLIADVIMPDGDAFDILPSIKKLRPNLPVILMSAQNTLTTAIKAEEGGADEYFPKPFDLDEVINATNRALSLQRKQLHLNNITTVDDQDGPIIGRSTAMQRVFRIIARSRDLDVPIFLTGQQGVGKTLVAQTLHSSGKRHNSRFVEARLSAMPKDSIEAQLFGFENSIGLIEQAHGGTIYIADIENLPIGAYTRFLRVISENTVQRMDGSTSQTIDIRMILASRYSLSSLGAFDKAILGMFKRLGAVSLNLPSLAQRSDDIVDLVQHFLRINEPEDKIRKFLDHEAMDTLKAYEWPGNIRELANIIQRLSLFHPQEVIDAETVEMEIQNSRVREDDYGYEGLSSFGTLSHATRYFVNRYMDGQDNLEAQTDLYQAFLAEFEVPLIVSTLEKTRGNQIQASKLLGLNRNTLRKKIGEYGIEVVKARHSSS